MPEDFAITGGGQLLAFSKALKRAGRKDLRKALHQGVQKAAKPLIKIDRAAALEKLPKGGGLNERMARAPQRVRVKTGTSPGVYLELPGKQRGYNDGRIRHPVFEKDKANRTRAEGAEPVDWVEQDIDGTWFDDTLAAAGPKVLPAIQDALEAVAAQIVREAKR